MAKVHPSLSFSLDSTLAKTLPSSTPHLPSIDSASLEGEAFTIWMKSLVLNGNGCTVYDRNGHLVYRVDNYDSKCSRQVYVMDHFGKVLVEIHRKNFRLFHGWEGYRCIDSQREPQRWFKVKKHFPAMKVDNHASCEVCGGPSQEAKQYKIDRMPYKSSYKIVGPSGATIAEINRKETATGIVLSPDVLNLVVAPDVEHSLIIGLVVVRGLMSNIM